MWPKPWLPPLSEYPSLSPSSLALHLVFFYFWFLCHSVSLLSFKSFVTFWFWFTSCLFSFIWFRSPFRSVSAEFFPLVPCSFFFLLLLPAAPPACCPHSICPSILPSLLFHFWPFDRIFLRRGRGAEGGEGRGPEGGGATVGLLLLLLFSPLCSVFYLVCSTLMYLKFVC